jgi:hypothetical protein
MKKNWLLKTVVALIVIGLLVASGFALYRVGYAHGAQASLSGDMASFWADHFDDIPHAEYWGSGNIPFGRSGSRMMDGYSQMPFGSNHMAYGFSGFFFLPFLFRVLFWGALIWLAYTLFKKSGWQFTKQTAPAAPTINEEPLE